MGRQPVEDTQAGFAGGLNVTSDPAFLRPDQCTAMTNVRLTKYGAAFKRLGTQQTSAAVLTTFNTTNSVYGGIWWPASSLAYVLAADDVSAAIHLYQATYAIPTTWTDLGALPQYRPVIFTDGTSNEIIYFAGLNTVLVQRYNGSAIAALGAATKKCAGLCVYNDRLWGWSGTGSSILPNFLYYSNLSSAVGSTGGDSIGDTGTGGGSILVQTFASSAIQACAAVNGSLLIFHQRGISVLTGWGQDDVQVQPQALNATIGMGTATADGVCVANELSTGDLAYFITPMGLYVTNGGFVRPIGTPDKPDPTAALLAAGTVVVSQFVIRFNRATNEVWCHIIGIGVYVYNCILESWSGPFTHGVYLNLKQVFEVVDTNGTPHTWGIAFNAPGAQGVSVSELDRAGVYKDMVTSAGTGGSAVTMTLSPHRMFGGERMFSKSWRWMNLIATLTSGSTAPSVVCTTQSGSNTQSLATPSSIEQAYYVSPGGWGPYVDVTVNDPGTNGTSVYAMATVQGNLLGQR